MLLLVNFVRGVLGCPRFALCRPHSALCRLSLTDRQTKDRRADIRLVRFRSAAGDRYEAVIRTRAGVPGLFLLNGFALGSLPEVVFLPQSPQLRGSIDSVSWAHVSCRGNHDPSQERSPLMPAMLMVPGHHFHHSHNLNTVSLNRKCP